MSKVKEVKVKVLKKHILEGLPNEGDSCPIALALMSKGYTDVNVDGEIAEVHNKKGNYMVAELPKKAQSFVTKFDDTPFNEETEEFEYTVKPFEFKLKFDEYLPEEETSGTDNTMNTEEDLDW